MAQIEFFSEFPDVSGLKMSTEIVSDALSVLLIFSGEVNDCAVMIRVLLRLARFAFTDLEIGNPYPDVLSCSVSEWPARPGLAKKSVDIHLDHGRICIDYGEIMCMKTVRTMASLLGDAKS